METLAYLHLELAHEAATSSEAEITIQQMKERRGQSETRKANSNLSFVFGTQLLRKLVPNLILNLIIRIQPIVLALVFMLSSPIFALTVRGNSGKDVVDLQNNLKVLGYFPKNYRSTGYFDKVTETSVRNFQKASRLLVDGKVGSDTRKSLDKAMHEYRAKQKIGKEYRSPILGVHSKGAIVAQLKEHLNGLDYSAGSGELFDKQTENAVKLFQQKNGLKIDGIVGAQTHMALWYIDRVHSNPESPIRYYYQGLASHALKNTNEENIKEEALESYIEYLKRTNDITEVTQLRLKQQKKENIYCSGYNQEVIKYYIDNNDNNLKFPSSTEQYIKRGKLFLWLGEIEYARDDFEQAIKAFETKINGAAKKPKYPKEYTDKNGELKLLSENHNYAKDDYAKDDFEKVIKELDKVTQEIKEKGYQVKDLASAYYYLAQSFVYAPDAPSLNDSFNAGSPDKKSIYENYMQYIKRTINYFEKANQLYKYANYQLSDSPKNLEAIQLKRELSQTYFTAKTYVIFAKVFEYEHDRDHANKSKEIKDIANDLIQADKKKQINLKSYQLAQAYYFRASYSYFQPNNYNPEDFKDDAIKDFTEALRINPYFYLNYPPEGYPCPEFKDDQQVLNDLNKKLNQNSQDTEALFNRGILFLQLRNEDSAIKDFNKVIDELKLKSLKDGKADAYSNRGFAYYRQKKYDKAINDFTKAIELTKEQVKDNFDVLADLYVIRALAFFDDGKYDDARDDCNRAIKVNKERTKNSNNYEEWEWTAFDSTAKAQWIKARALVALAGNDQRKIENAEEDVNNFNIEFIAPGSPISPLGEVGPGGESAKTTSKAQKIGFMKKKGSSAKQPKPSTPCQQ